MHCCLIRYFFREWRLGGMFYRRGYVSTVEEYCIVHFYTPLSESLVPFDREVAGRRLHSIRKASEFDKEGV